jgi:hypothetical protein
LELKVGNKIISKPAEITDKLNSHFINTVKEMIKHNNNGSTYVLQLTRCPNSTFIYPVTEEEVISLTKSLKGKTTSGVDDIPENLVKQCIHVTKGPFSHVYNLSLNSGVFPDLQKTAEVKPQHKKGDKNDMHNYRPISIIPVFAKLSERLMYNRMTSFLYENKMLSEAQNSFRKCKSLDTDVQTYTERIQEALDKLAHKIGIFIDLFKAYDVLNHNLLLEKLFHYGIRGTANSWFRSYVFCRRKFIEICQSNLNNGKVNTYRSSSLDIEQGVPQGSVLGPLLFLLYINDLPVNVHDAKLVMFANDISVLISDSDTRELQIKIDRVVTELETWLNRNDPVINTGKTGVMSFHNRQPHFLVKPIVTFNKTAVAYTSETNFLGI